MDLDSPSSSSSEESYDYLDLHRPRPTMGDIFNLSALADRLTSIDQSYNADIESPNEMLVDSDEFLNDGDAEKDDADVAIIHPDEQPLRGDDCMFTHVPTCRSLRCSSLTASIVEAMKELVLTPLAEQPPILEDVVNTWNITDWDHMRRREEGPVFQAGGHPW